MGNATTDKDLQSRELIDKEELCAVELSLWFAMAKLQEENEGSDMVVVDGDCPDSEEEMKSLDNMLNVMQWKKAVTNHFSRMDIVQGLSMMEAWMVAPQISALPVYGDVIKFEVPINISK